MADIKTILVVDDDPGIARLVGATLEDEGYAAEVLTDGRHVVERAQALQPDLILLDVVMPFVGLDEHLRQLRGTPATRHIPVVLVTADSRAIADLDRWQSFGVVDCVRKPFDLVDLTTRVKQVLAPA
jgi:two-component system cell cycle response regulator